MNPYHAQPCAVHSPSRSQRRRFRMKRHAADCAVASLRALVEPSALLRPPGTFHVTSPPVEQKEDDISLQLILNSITTLADVVRTLVDNLTQMNSSSPYVHAQLQCSHSLSEKVEELSLIHISEPTRPY